MYCVSTVSYFIFINCEPQAPFKLTRGIRQGDHLSPYLFIICAEALSILLCHAVSVKSISSVPIGSGPVVISHIFFVDDSLFFCKANSIEWSNLVFILNLYEHAFGQFFNKDKTSFFSIEIPLPISSKHWLSLLVLRLGVSLRSI